MSWISDINQWMQSPKVEGILSIAEKLGKLTIVVGILSYIWEAPERSKQRHYQAWQLINAARTSPGEAGRAIAIADLMADHTEMIELDLTRGNFMEMNFKSANMPGVNFSGARIDGAHFACKSGWFVSDHWIPAFDPCWTTNLEGAHIITSSITRVEFDDARLNDAILGGSPEHPTAIENNSFVRAQMQEVTVQASRLSNNDFSHACMKGSWWLGGTMGLKNAFVGADLTGARWYGLNFQDNNDVDFTDADLSDVTVSNDIVPPLQGAELLREEDKRLEKVKLCRTKFSNGVSNRNCPTVLSGGANNAVAPLWQYAALPDAPVLLWPEPAAAEPAKVCVPRTIKDKSSAADAAALTIHSRSLAGG
jgi:uncharacterized protein YjbI with pentapeptide repeats